MWTKGKAEDLLNPTSTLSGAVEKLAAATGRTLVTFDNDIGQEKFNKFLDYVRQYLPQNTLTKSITDISVEPEPRVWRKSRVALVPAAFSEMAQLPFLKKLFGITSIEPEQYFRATIDIPAKIEGTATPPPVAATALDMTRVSNSKFTGAEVKVAILDTGITPAHAAFASNRIIHSASFLPGQPIDDVYGHGTHIASVVCGATIANSPRFGVAPRAQILAGRVMTDIGLTTEAAILDGIEWARDHGADIIVMAFGGAVAIGQKHSTAIEAAARAALSAGVLLIAESGNDPAPNGIFPVHSPANCPSILAVGSVDAHGRPSHFSCGKVNADGEVNVVAPGENVLGAWPPSNTKILHGTSQAAAIAAGVAALWAESDAALRGAALWRQLELTAKVISGKPEEVGFGLVQAP